MMDATCSQSLILPAQYPNRIVSGFSLIEVLVSVVVISIGLLGLIALQTNSLRYNHDAMLRSLAITQISEMADRMRANPAGLAAGSYNSVNTGTTTPTNPSCTTCTPAEIAQRDIYEWYTENNNLLPGSVGQITRASNVYTIQITYQLRQDSIAIAMTVQI